MTVHTHPFAGRLLVSTLLGAPVLDLDGRRVGTVRDVAVDLAVSRDRPPVTSVLLQQGRRRWAVPWPSLTPEANGRALVLTRQAPPPEPGSPRELHVRRDLLDTPVIVVDPPRRARVSDVVLETGPRGAWVVELDISTAGVLRRLTRGSGSGAGSRARPGAAVEPVRMSEVHLGSAVAHAAQLADPDASILSVGPQGLAEILTRAPVAQAREILRLADPDVAQAAVDSLHPHVRSRVTGRGTTGRRTRRLAGWRLHRPRAADERKAPS